MLALRIFKHKKDKKHSEREFIVYTFNRRIRETLSNGINKFASDFMNIFARIRTNP